jgi:hypothetical protein
MGTENSRQRRLVRPRFAAKNAPAGQRQIQTHIRRVTEYRTPLARLRHGSGQRRLREDSPVNLPCGADLSSGRPEKGFYIACSDLKPDRQFVVNAGLEQYPIDANTTAIGVPALARMLSALTI